MSINLSTPNMEALPPITTKKKRSLPGHPDPDAEVISLSPKSLMETNKYVCEICGKGFQRDQNLQLHRRGHNLPWRLKQKPKDEVRKKVYVCPEPACVHHDPARALGDLTGIKKHYSRKHGEKKWKCEKCTKKYAVQSDWKAHQKICGTREYRCDCGTLFSRRDSFITHRAFCDALAEENNKVSVHSQYKDQQLCSTTPLSGGISTSMEVPSSPISQLTGEALTSSEVSNPPMFTSCKQSTFSLAESGIASSSSSEAWVKCNTQPNVTAPSKGPGLSLCLGRGPGPGPGPPPSALGMMGNQSASCSGPPFFMMHQSPNVLNKLGSESHANSIHGPSSSSVASISMFENIFASSANGYSRHDAGNNSMASVSSYAKDPQIGDFIPAYGMPPSRLSPNMATDFRSTNGPPKPSQTATAAMSATALLQKAAQMGATISDPSLYQKFGMGDKASSIHMAPGAQRQSSLWAGSMPGPMPVYPKMRHGGGDDIMSSEGMSSVSATSGRSVEEFMNLVSGGGGRMYRDNMSSSYSKSGDIMPCSSGGSSNLGCKLINNIHEREQSNPNPNPNPNPNAFGDMRRFSTGMDHHIRGSLKHEGEVAMVDFLGVGGSNLMNMQYGTANADILNSHRDLGSISSFNSVLNMDRSNLSYQNNR